MLHTNGRRLGDRRTGLIVHRRCGTLLRRGVLHINTWRLTGRGYRLIIHGRRSTRSCGMLNAYAWRLRSGRRARLIVHRPSVHIIGLHHSMWWLQWRTTRRWFRAIHGASWRSRMRLNHLLMGWLRRSIAMLLVPHLHRRWRLRTVHWMLTGLREAVWRRTGHRWKGMALHERRFATFRHRRPR
jgi:hypothetical protein